MACTPDGAPQQEVNSERLLCDLAIWLWRLYHHVSTASEANPSGSLGPALRDIEAIRGVLEEWGVQIRDPLGEVVPSSGHSNLNIVSHEARADAMGVTVVQTLLPEVRLHGRLVRSAEVIASRPATEDSSEQPAAFGSCADEDREEN